MEVKLYSTHCPKCNVIEKKLKEKGIEFELIDDIDKVVEFGQSVDKSTAPLLVVDDKVMEFVEANKYLITLEV